MLDATQIFDGTPPNTGAAITVSRISTNIIDLGSLRDVGVGNAIELHVGVLQTFLTLTSLQVKLQACATSGGTYADVLLSPVIPLADLNAGQGIFGVVIPRLTQPNQSVNPAVTLPRFLQLSYVVGGANATAGTVFAYINAAPDRNVQFAYPRNYAVV